MRSSAATTSAVLHGAAVLILFTLFRSDLMEPASQFPVKKFHATVLHFRFKREAGGGQREVLPASKGRLPPPATQRLFVPPTAHILNEHPRLPVQQAVLLDPELSIPPVQMDRIGSPFGVDEPLSGGRGGPAGIGDGGCCGAGDGKGPGVGGLQPVRAYVLRGQTSLPVLIYKVEPEYSDEARKARVQGLVLLTAEVDPNGRTQNIRVARPLGLGLDEQAVAAAARWRFRPAMNNGRAVAYTVTIEINFRLL